MIVGKRTYQPSTAQVLAENHNRLLGWVYKTTLKVVLPALVGANLQPTP